MVTESWEIRAAGKRQSILDQIPKEWKLSTADINKAKAQRDITGPFIEQFLDNEEIKITSYDAVELVNQIQQGKLTAVQVTTAFSKRAAIAHQIGNCLLEFFFDKALERAKELDAYFAQNQRTIGPLHGLPISLKDQFHVKGVDTSMAYVGWIGRNHGFPESQTHQVESLLTTDLLSLGAVLYCKTSLPQTLFFGETVNNITGITPNPQNQLLSCGGSSGGEGALIALGGSVLGVGTDIGGSVRVPAAFNGIYSIKPSVDRVSYKDVATTNPGQTIWPSTAGFMGSSLSGVTLALQSTLSTKPWLRDPAVVPIPFREDVYQSYKSLNRPLKFGIVWSDGIANPHPPISRGLKRIVTALREAGHGVVDWNPPSHSEAMNIHLNILLADASADVREQLALSGEPLVPGVMAAEEGVQPMGLLEYQALTLEGKAYENAYAEYWNANTGEDGEVVDAVIMPVAPSAAVRPGKFYHIAYTEVLNMLNYSTVVVPVHGIKADKEVDVVDQGYQPSSETDRLNWGAYDPEIFYGAPVGVQIVGRKFEEEKVLGIAEVVDEVLKAHTK
ncbi:Acetamidase [Triangularia verruculosa]|uniref:amidase n=1 Tax=Triangularia verruculosa TaxID=2587418 RepID=A0AAN7AYS2_9PEZI|nr:Acetamidase [Triangularia verruculosa]